MSTFVLIHGAWHGAWCWNKVIPELEALGHKAVAPDLPGLGNDPRPPRGITLDDYIACIVQSLDAQEGKVFLVGHSMGGMAITGAAELRSSKLHWLIYLAAFLPRDGECLLAIEERNPDPRVPPIVIPSEDREVLMLSEEKITEVFYLDCSDADIAFAKARLRPQPAKPLSGAVHITERNFGRVPRAYIECTEDGAIVVDFQRAMVRASPCRRVISLDAGHSPFFSIPRPLAGVLSDLAAG
ncbi:MAG: alpha/beta fold hydrolase [Gammaproteobacteria bacterium]|nr:alpha/beta fold hydrolase [Gammaproteobacteria bacterium]